MTVKAVVVGLSLGLAACVSTVSSHSQLPYDQQVQRAAAHHSVDAELIHRVIAVESRWQARAVGARGEIGLMQIKPSTARSIGFEGTVSELMDPQTNVYYGTKYLRMALDRADGDWCSAVMLYNRGIHSHLRRSGAYCNSVMRVEL